MSDHIINWRTSSRSQGQGTCVEVGFAEAVVGVRDTKDRAGGLLSVEPAAWRSFVARVKGSGFVRS